MTNTHGGRRPGSGRKPGKDWNGSGEYKPKIKRQISIDPDVWQWLLDTGNASQTIERLARREMANKVRDR